MLNGRFDDQVIIVTGGTGALGTAVVAAFLREGGRAIAVGRSPAKLDALRQTLDAEPGDLECETADLTNEEDVGRVVERVLERHGRVDVLANIAGGFLGGVELAEMTAQQWDFMHDLNLRTVFYMCRAVLPAMKTQRRGKIVNVASKAALDGGAGMAAYAAAKAGVRILTRSVAEEVKDAGINVNAVVPSVIDTPPNRKAMPNADFSTWVSPEEIAQVILFLASDDARAINGAEIPVYGRT